MSSLKSTVEKLKNLETEKLSLLAEIEELKKIAEAKSNTLADEIAALREEINSLKEVIEPQQPPSPPSEESLKEKNLVYMQGLAEKALNESKQLGSLVFPALPFSQNFDNWLANFQKIVTDFEAQSNIYVDDQFAEDRSRIFLDVEGALTKIKVEETNCGAVEKALAYNNHFLLETDKEYAEKTKQFSLKKDAQLQILSNRVNEIERQLKVQEEENKHKYLKKRTDDKTPQLTQNLKTAKSDLEAAQKSFADEQNNLNADYEKKKEDIIREVESLRRKLEQLEADTSIEARQAACQALSNAINALLERNSSIA